MTTNEKKYNQKYLTPTLIKKWKVHKNLQNQMLSTNIKLEINSHIPDRVQTFSEDNIGVNLNLKLAKPL